MNSAAEKIPVGPPASLMTEQYLQVCADELGEQLQRSITAEVDRVIAGQTTPQAFVVGAQAQLQNPDGGDPIEAQAYVQIEPTPVAVFGTTVNHIPTVPVPPVVQITMPHTNPLPPAATLEETIAQVTAPHINEPISTQSVQALEREIANAIMAHQEAPIPTTTVPPMPPANEMVYNLGQAANLYQYQATNIQVTQPTNVPITVTLGGGTGAAGGNGGQITYRWVQQGDGTQQPVLHASTDLGTVGWNNTYTQYQTAIYQQVATQAQTWYVQGGTAGTGAITYGTGVYANLGDYTYTIDTNGNWSANYGLSKKDQLKQKFRQQLSAAARKRRILDEIKKSPAELKARDTLRDMLSEADWRRYVTNSFIMVRGVSGKWYQVFANHDYERIRVYEKGEHIANLCIHSDAECPPTDHVIAMKIQIELDEDSIWTDSNRYGANGHNTGNTFINIPFEAGGVAVLNADGTQNPYVAGNVQGNIINNGFHVTAEGQQILGQMLAGAAGIPEGALQGGPVTAAEVLAC